MADEKISKSESEWREQLDSEQFQVTRCSGTERPFTGRYWNSKAAGTYKCVCCGQELFRSETKYDSGTGWPSFFRPIQDDAVVEHRDASHGMVRMEVVCSRRSISTRTRPDAPIGSRPSTAFARQTFQAASISAHVDRKARLRTE